MSDIFVLQLYFSDVTKITTDSQIGFFLRNKIFNQIHKQMKTFTRKISQ